jgi:hypothetical protein
VTKSYLLDGPIMLVPERRAAMLDRMAADISAAGVADCEQDCVRVLMHAGYGYLNIAILAGQARNIAIVMREMAGS